ncbi:hypothetical protein M407DRAFT_33475, partial [Tulasnella calospora MUT 4182]
MPLLVFAAKETPGRMNPEFDRPSVPADIDPAIAQAGREVSILTGSLPSDLIPDSNNRRTYSMSLIYALVARGGTVLAAHSGDKRDFSQATQAILSKIPPNNSKLTYVWEQYLFHYISEGGLTFLVMADDAVGRRMPFAFLGELQQRFTTKYPPDVIYAAGDNGLDEFDPEIGRLMHQFSTSPPPDALNQARQDLAQVKDIMVQNVEQILSRGERIELL